MRVAREATHLEENVMSKNSVSVVLCADYNGSKNVLFLMRDDDFRMNDGNWARQCGATKKGSSVYAHDGRIFTCHADWSLTLLATIA
jgi:hypothetical protein